MAIMFSVVQVKKLLIMVTFVGISTPGLAVENATYDDFLKYYISQKPELKQDSQFIEAYAYYRHCKKMYGHKSSQFTQRKAINGAKKELEALGDIAKPSTISVSERKKFGRYNFDTQSFPYYVFKEGAVFALSSPAKGSCRSRYKQWPSAFKVNLSNSGIIKSVQVEDEVVAEKAAKQFITALGTLEIKSIDLNAIDKQGVLQPEVSGTMVGLEVSAGVGYGGRKKLPVKTFTPQELAKLSDEQAKAVAIRPLKFTPNTIANYRKALQEGNASSLNPILIPEAEYLNVNFGGSPAPEEPKVSISKHRDNGKIHDTLSYRFGSQSYHFTIINADDFSVDLPLSDEMVRAIKAKSFGAQAKVDYYIRPVQVLNDKPNHMKVVLEKMSLKYQNILHEKKLYVKEVKAK